MDEKGRKAVRLIISGKVQGVWFRNWTVGRARALSLDGWVRNRTDGTVEALLAGPADTVDEMIARCREGPKLARVDDVVQYDVRGAIPKGFAEKPTADVGNSYYG